MLRGPDVYRSGAYGFFLMGIICLPSSEVGAGTRSAAGMASTGDTLALKRGLVNVNCGVDWEGQAKSEATDKSVRPTRPAGQARAAVPT